MVILDQDPLEIDDSVIRSSAVDVMDLVFTPATANWAWWRTKPGHSYKKVNIESS
jgi:hypothetical protein